MSEVAWFRLRGCTLAGLPLSILVLFALAIPASADDAAPQITGVRLGYNGLYKVGFWTPVEVTIQATQQLTNAELDLIVPDGDGVPTRLTIPLDNKTIAGDGRESKIEMFAKIGQMRPDVTVRLRCDGSEIAQTFRASAQSIPLGLTSARPLVLTVGPTDKSAAPPTDADGDHSTIHAAIAGASQLPSAWYGYDAAAAVIVYTSDPQIFSGLAATDPRIAALDRWVRMGGRLMLCVASEAETVLAAGAPLADFAPGTFAGAVALKRASAWETYAETTDRLDAQSLVDGRGPLDLTVPRLQAVRGRVEVYEGSQATDLPLVVRTPRGLGEVVFVAADLDRAPFVNWPARQVMLDRLLGKLAFKRDESRETKTPVDSTFGYGDLAGQLRSSLEQFEGVTLLPFALVASLILLYIIAIGPLDYLLLKRGLRRMEWTWYTFPVIVLAFSGAAYYLAQHFKGRQLLTNQVDIVDYDAESKLVRGTTWSNIFSPRVDAYNLQYKPALIDLPDWKSESLMSWMGLPGTGFGGMSDPAGAAPLFTSAYSFAPKLNALYEVPIAVWSTKGITCRWSGESNSPIVAELTDRGDTMLSGSIQSRLDAPLTDCVLVYDRWAYPIAKLDARARISVEKKLDPQTVETYFKHISLFNEHDPISTYDPASLEVGRIVEAMMFHQLLGGGDYTRLSNEYQQFVDLSSLLKCGRAMLVGRGPVSGGQLMRDGKPVENEANRRWTFYRFVFPVSTKDAALR